MESKSAIINASNQEIFNKFTENLENLLKQNEKSVSLKTLYEWEKFKKGTANQFVGFVDFREKPKESQALFSFKRINHYTENKFDEAVGYIHTVLKIKNNLEDGSIQAQKELEKIKAIFASDDLDRFYSEDLDSIGKFDVEFYGLLRSDGILETEFLAIKAQEKIADYISLKNNLRNSDAKEKYDEIFAQYIPNYRYIKAIINATLPIERLEHWPISRSLSKCVEGQCNTPYQYICLIIDERIRNKGDQIEDHFDELKYFLVKALMWESLKEEKRHILKQDIDKFCDEIGHTELESVADLKERALTYLGQQIQDIEERFENRISVENRGKLLKKFNLDSLDYPLSVSQSKDVFKVILEEFKEEEINQLLVTEQDREEFTKYKAEQLLPSLLLAAQSEIKQRMPAPAPQSF